MEKQLIEAEKILKKHLQLRDFEIVGEKADNGHQRFKISFIELSYTIEPTDGAICRIRVFFDEDEVDYFNVHTLSCLPAVDRVLFRALRYALK